MFVCLVCCVFWYVGCSGTSGILVFQVLSVLRYVLSICVCLVFWYLCSLCSLVCGVFWYLWCVGILVIFCSLGMVVCFCMLCILGCGIIVYVDLLGYFGIVRMLCLFVLYFYGCYFWYVDNWVLHILYMLIFCVYKKPRVREQLNYTHTKHTNIPNIFFFRK